MGPLAAAKATRELRMKEPFILKIYISRIGVLSVGVTETRRDRDVAALRECEIINEWNYALRESKNY